MAAMARGAWERTKKGKTEAKKIKNNSQMSETRMNLPVQRPNTLCADRLRLNRSAERSGRSDFGLSRKNRGKATGKTANLNGDNF
jgi:hypothetical protein